MISNSFVPTLCLCDTKDMFPIKTVPILSYAPVSLRRKNGTVNLLVYELSMEIFFINRFNLSSVAVPSTGV